MNIRTKINIGCAFLVMVVVLGMMTSLYISERKALLTEIRESQKDDLEKLAKVFNEVHYEENEIILLNYIIKLTALPKVAYAGFVNKNGTGWVYLGPDRPFTWADRKDPIIDSLMKSTNFMRREIETKEGTEVIEVSRPVEKKGHVRLAYSAKVVQSEVSHRLGQILKKLTAVGFLAILLGLFFAHLLSTALSAPIFNLTQAARAIAKGKKGVTVKDAGSDELGELTRTFNDMSQELAKLDELKDEFMSHVTHELRSPLTSIIATVELMDEMPQAVQPKLRRSIDRLKYGSERLNKLVDNILDLMRMQAGKMRFDIQPVQIGTLVCEMVDFFEPRAQEKNLFIRSNVPKALGLAKGDAERIRQILSNLIHNAIKFTNDGGITVRASEVGNEIHVAVQDTGVGIPKDKLSTIFQKFETLKDTRDRVNQPVPGSGLGLNIVLNSITAQQGRIWVDSEVNKGTTFTFSLPIALGQPKENTQDPKQRGLPRTEKRGAIVFESPEKAG